MGFLTVAPPFRAGRATRRTAGPSSREVPFLSRLTQTFARLQNRDEAALVTFVTAGDPSPAGTSAVICALADAGADIVELGIPYSDPLADGPSIQASSQRALDKGVTPPAVLEMVKAARTKTDVPIVLMTSYNLVLRAGLEKFARDAAEAGADGTILTDLPPEEAASWKTEADKVGLATIFLVAPTSTPERVKTIVARATGFVYCVSRTGVTGGRAEMAAGLREYVQSVKRETETPVCVGFGISTPAHVAQVAAFADGVVIGATLVDFLHAHAESLDEVRALVRSWKNATRREGK